MKRAFMIDCLQTFDSAPSSARGHRLHANNRSCATHHARMTPRTCRGHAWQEAHAYTHIDARTIAKDQRSHCCCGTCFPWWHWPPIRSSIRALRVDSIETQAPSSSFSALLCSSCWPALCDRKRDPQAREGDERRSGPHGRYDSATPVCQSSEQQGTDGIAGVAP